MTDDNCAERKIEKRATLFEQNSKSASDAMRLISSTLLFPTLAFAYKEQTFVLVPGSNLFYALLFFCLYFLSDLFQYLFKVICIHLRKDDKSWSRKIQYALFYGKFCVGILGLIFLILSIMLRQHS